MNDILCALDATGNKTPILLCTKCYSEAFSPQSWTKLQGLHPNTTARHGKSSDPMHDGEFAYTHVYMNTDNATSLPHQRDPILRLRRCVEGWTEAKATCCLCRVVCDLDDGGRLRGGEYADAMVDLQLFYAKVQSGVRLPWLLSVRLEVERKGDVGDERLWQRRGFLGMMFEDEERFGRVGGEDGIEPGMDEERPSIDERDADIGVLGLLNNARMWMKECEESHAGCASLTSVLLPTRVLHARAYEDTFIVKLVETTESRQQGNYTALSYVWGTRPTLRLFKSNRSAFLENIAYNDLPRTMQDAVQATCALGITNLWIDALCIVQDDDTDKEVELPHMNEYYQHASAVISASGASDAHMGFLTDQTPGSGIYAEARARILFTHPKFGAVSYRIPFRTSMGITTCILDTQPSLYNHNAEPINKRGWTLQESTLAKRLLIFPSTGRLIARCDNGVRCFGEVLGDSFHEDAGLGHRKEQIAKVGNSDRKGEKSDDESDKQMVNVQNPSLTVTDVGSGDEQEDEASEGSSELLERIYQGSWDFEQEMNRRETECVAGLGAEVSLEQEKAAKMATLVDEWIATVQDYTRRNLTHPGDILIALGALAKNYHDTNSHLVGSYVAGLWKESLLEGLMWQTSTDGHLDDDEPSMFPTHLRQHRHAPSWSWASCGRPVRFRIDKEPDLVMRGKPEEPKWCCEVLDCVITPRSQLNFFGAVIGGYLDVRCMLLPIERHLEIMREGEYYRSTRDGSALTIKLADSGESDLHDCETLSADSPDAAALMLDVSVACFWMPVYDATRGRSRGLIVRQEADGNFRRLGFAQFVFARAATVGMRTIRVV